jgi:hypothetical protein
LKVKLLVVALLAFFVLVGSAEAFVWHLSYYRAKAATKDVERRICERDGQCIAYGASCKRISESRIDCIGGTVYETKSAKKNASRSSIGV